jgi:hypothetical protein
VPCYKEGHQCGKPYERREHMLSGKAGATANMIRCPVNSEAGTPKDLTKTSRCALWSLAIHVPRRDQSAMTSKLQRNHSK